MGLQRGYCSCGANTCMGSMGHDVNLMTVSKILLEKDIIEGRLHEDLTNTAEDSNASAVRALDYK